MDAHLIIVLLVALLGVRAAQVKTETPSSVPTVFYCELIRDPNLYEGKLVRVAATWNYGFEWSYLYHRDCIGRENKAWVEFVDEDKGCERTKKVSKKLKDKFDNKADIVAVGTLQGGGGYGDGGYQYQFVITCLEEAKQTPANAP
jgi:hypothetical protein